MKKNARRLPPVSERRADFIFSGHIGILRPDSLLIKIKNGQMVSYIEFTSP
jgi:hypothetical protein